MSARPAVTGGGVRASLQHPERCVWQTMLTRENGYDCAAPGQALGGHRTWANPHELVQLQIVLDAAERRTKRAAPRRKQRERHAL